MAEMQKTARKLAGRESARMKEARAQARKVKAEVDAERVERDRKVRTAQEGFYVAQAAREDALALAEDHWGEMADQVDALLEIGESAEMVARLCGLDDAELKTLRRLAQDRRSAGAGSDVADLAGRRPTTDAPEALAS